MEPQDWFEAVFDADYLAIYSQNLDPQQAEREAEKIVKMLGLSQGAKVLDCPCGTGRHARVLAAKGFDVVGVDRSKVFLEIARREAPQLKSGIQFVEADIRRLPEEFAGSFDGAFSMFTSFGYFESDEENRRVMAELARSVRTGGCVLVETSNFLFKLDGRFQRTWFRGNACTVLDELTYDWQQDQIAHRRIVYFDNGRKREVPAFRVRAYKPRDFTRFAEEVGLSVRGLHGGLDGKPFEPLSSKRLVLLAEKR